MGDSPLPTVPPPSAAALRARHRTTNLIAPIVFVVLALLLLMGVVGNGPLSWRTVRDGDLAVSFERFTRRGSTWTMTVEAPTGQDGATSVRLDRSLVQAVLIDSIEPQPDAVRNEADWLVYEFAGRGAGRTASVEFHVTADSLWSQQGEVRAQGGLEVTVEQFVYP